MNHTNATNAIGVLGLQSDYPSHYDPSLLFPIARAPQRETLGLGQTPARLPFLGADFWTAYEVSWLNPRGKPQVCIVQFTFPAETPNIIESKSFKLYLASFNQSRFDSDDAVRDCLRRDLSEAAWRGSGSQSTIGVRLIAPDEFDAQSIAELDGVNIDRLDVECDTYLPQAAFLHSDQQAAHITETLTSRLLKSNCPVTGQPDWACLQVRYSGHPIDQAGLLRYVVSYRNHNGFHEHCVEQIFSDIWKQCQPVHLSVYARYTRRGGLDINPYRSSEPQSAPANRRTARQ